MIYVHPATASNPALLGQLQLATGLRAVTGQRFARLIPTQSAAAKQTAFQQLRNALDYRTPSPTAPVKVAGQSRHEITQCTYCQHRTNTQGHGDNCRRCRAGVMVAGNGNSGGNGGNAA
jgi:hypothetical protein